MRITRLALVMGSVLLASPLAFAGGVQVPNSQVKVEPAPQKPARERLICRAPVSNGMLLPRAKQCYTQAEWDARQKRMQNTVRGSQMRNLMQQN